MPARQRRRLPPVLGLLMALAAVACTTAATVQPSATPEGASPDPSHATLSPSPTESSPMPDPALSASPQPSTDVPVSVIDRILEAASAETGMPVADLVVREARLVTWPDAGLGCPPPGMVYPQVPVDGAQVVVVAGMRVLDYRTGHGKTRLCL